MNRARLATVAVLVIAAQAVASAQAPAAKCENTLFSRLASPNNARVAVTFMRVCGGKVTSGELSVLRKGDANPTNAGNVDLAGHPIAASAGWSAKSDTLFVTSPDGPAVCVAIRVDSVTVVYGQSRPGRGKT